MRHRDTLLAGVTLVLAVALAVWDATPFERYFGDISAVLVVAIVVLLGAPALARVRSEAGTFSTRGILSAAAVSTFLAIVVIVVDTIAVPFGAHINVPFPKSILFYPVMAVVVEVLFHLVPLALLSLWKRTSRTVDFLVVAALAR